MKFTLDASDPQSKSTACLVVGVHSSGDLPESTQALDDASGGRIKALIRSGDIARGTGKTTFLHGLDGVAAERVLVVGAGKPDELDGPVFDRICLAAGKALRNAPVTEAHVCLNELSVAERDQAWTTRQAALACGRGNYRYTRTKKPKKHAPPPVESISLAGGDDLADAVREAGGLLTGILRAIELGDLPPNICNPEYLAETARDIEKTYDNVDLEVLDREEMQELGMNALLAVSQGSEFPPYLIVLKYHGTSDKQDPVVFVGKGITFDTGGISIKPRENMDQMKYDMCGAASVIGAFEACAALQLPINLVAIVGAVENMPDGRAYRPGDVITSMSGQTIEVLNTDAEGRMVLCDALTYAERFEPKAIVDVATLTGACVVALGHHASGLMTPHDDLADELLGAGLGIVDRAWRMPLWEEYQEQIDSPFADMKNVGGMPAGSITAGCFLARFMKKQRWAHLDVAGTAWKWGKTDNATGRPTGLLTQFLIDQT